MEAEIKMAKIILFFTKYFHVVKNIVLSPSYIKPPLCILTTGKFFFNLAVLGAYHIEKLKHFIKWFHCQKIMNFFFKKFSKLNFAAILNF
jgi:hypothetical protein